MNKYYLKPIQSRTNRFMLIGSLILSFVAAGLATMFFILTDYKNMATVGSFVSAVFGLSINIALNSYQYHCFRKEYYSVPQPIYKLDHGETVDAVVDKINRFWLCDHGIRKVCRKNLSKPIIIAGKSVVGTGKTSFLRELELKLKRKKRADIKLGRVRRKLGKIFAFDANDCDVESFLQELPDKKSRFWINIIIVDNVTNCKTIADAFGQKGYFSILAANKSINLNDKNVVELKALDKEQTKQYLEFRTDPNVDLKVAEKFLQMTGGSIKKLDFNCNYDEIVKNCAGFATNAYKIAMQRELSEIETKLVRGEYSIAESELRALQQKYNDLINNNYMLEFEYVLKYADTLHLLNKYRMAIWEISKLIDKDKSQQQGKVVILPQYQPFNQDYQVEIALAHYYKHKGRFDDAISIEKQTHKKCKLMSLYLLKTLDYLLQDGGNKTLDDRVSSLHNAFDCYIKDFSNLNGGTATEQEYYYRYWDVYEWFGEYSNNGYAQICKCTPDNSEKAYANFSRGKRLEANDMFVKAEITRVALIKKQPGNLTSKLKDLVPCYIHIWALALRNHDYNLQSQVEAILYYLEVVYKIPNSLAIDIAAVKQRCIEKEMEFNQSICHALLQIKNKVSVPSGIKPCDYFRELFDKIPFIIL